MMWRPVPARIVCVRSARSAVRGGLARCGILAAAIALRMLEPETIHAARGREPIILLDDVFAELDPGRSQRIVDWIETEEGGQVILTSPKPTDFRLHGETLPRWGIRDGVVLSD
jgi:hypothetical protein